MRRSMFAAIGTDSERHPRTYGHRVCRVCRVSSAFLVGFLSFALTSTSATAQDRGTVTGTIVEVGCNAHARRKFFEAQSNAKDRAEHALREIGRLYEIERVLREQDAHPAEL